MIIYNLGLFLAFFFILIKSADYATRYCTRLARVLRLSEFIVSFFIVAVISTLPEGTISIISAIKGIPEFGFGTLIGSNVADLALVFGLIAIISAKGIRVKSEIIKEDFFYLILLLFPILLALDGYISRIDGALLVLAGAFFFFTLYRETKRIKRNTEKPKKEGHWIKNFLLLILCLIILAVSANYTIKFGIDFAKELQISPIFIGLIMVSIGTCLPELLFSIRAIRRNHDELALGDILGTVITDATILVGIVALIQPFYFKPEILYVTGFAMFIAGVLAINFIRTGKILTKKEGIFLLAFYLLYLVVELFVNKVI